MEGPDTMEEDAPKPRPALLSPPILDRLGIDELQSYIAGLRAEIVRVEAEITRKQGLRSAADRFFKMP